MEITVPRTTYDRVKLTPDNVNEVARNKLRSMLYPGEYVAQKFDGKKDKTLWLVADEDHHRGSVRSNYLREATEEEITIYNTLKLIK